MPDLARDMSGGGGVELHISVEIELRVVRVNAAALMEDIQALDLPVLREDRSARATDKIPALAKNRRPQRRYL